MKKQDKLVQEIQFVENNLQNLLIQKQVFQIELSETQSALKEIENSGEDVFKIVGQIMIKADKEKIKEELLNKKKILELRLKSIEKQEDFLKEKLEKLKKEILEEKK